MSSNGKGQRPPGIGLIGCGQWGLNYLRAFSELDGCKVVAASDTSLERLRQVSRRYPAVRTASSPDLLLEEPAVTAVVVATPATQHFKVARAVLESGRDCLVEKPMTTSVDDARRLRDLAQGGNRILMVGHVFRFNAGIGSMQRLIASGAIGELEYLYFTRTNLGPIRSDVNVVWDLMTHDVSILLHFLNQSPAWISAQGASYLRHGCEDIAFATLGFDGGVIANIRASWLDPRKVREITVVGSSKMAFFNDLETSEPVRVFDKGTLKEPTYESFGEFKHVTRSGDVLSPAIPVSEPLKNQCQHFLQAVANQRRPLSDVEDGLRVVEILTAINRSIASRGVPQALTPAMATA